MQNPCHVEIQTIRFINIAKVVGSKDEVSRFVGNSINVCWHYHRNSAGEGRETREGDSDDCRDVAIMKQIP